MNLRGQAVVLLFGALMGFGATAATYTWSGAEGDGKWSTPGNWQVDSAAATAMPGAADAVVFSSGSDATTVDADFGGSVMALTMEAGFTGSITLGRTFFVVDEWTQASGSFIAGDYDVQLGNCKAKTERGVMTHSGGLLSFPSGTFLWYPAHTIRFSDTGGTWDANGGTFAYKQPGGGCTSYFDVAGRTFYNFSVVTMGVGNGWIYYSTTNTVAGNFSQATGAFQGSSVDAPGYFIVHGDLSFSADSQGGDVVLKLETSRDQTVSCFYKSDTAGVAPSLLVCKPAGSKVTFTGNVYCHRYRSSYAYHQGITVESGTVDFSGLDSLRLYSRMSGFWFDDSAVVTFPTNVSLVNWAPMFRVNGATFTDLELTAGSTTPLLDGTTNTVKRRLYLSNGAFHAASSFAANRRTFSEAGMSGREFSTASGRASTASGAIRLEGDLVLDGTGNQAASGLILLTGTGTQTVHQVTTRGVPRMIIDKPEGSVAVFETETAAGFRMDKAATTCYDDFWLKSGTADFSSCAALRWETCYSSFVQTGGHLLTGTAPFDINIGARWIGISLSEPAYAVYCNTNGTSQATIKLLSSTLVTTNRLIIGCCSFDGSGYLSAEGDVTVQANHTVKEQTSLYFRGGNDQEFRNEGGVPLYGTYGGTPFNVSKTGGTLTVRGDFDFAYSMRTAVITNAVVVLDGCTFNFSGETDVYLRKDGILRSINGGRLLCQNLHLYSGAGLGFDFSIPTDAETGLNPAPFAPRSRVYGEQNGVLNLEVFPKVTSRSPKSYDVVSWSSIYSDWKGMTYDYQVQPRMHKEKAEVLSSEKVLRFSYHYLLGLGIVFR